MPTTLHLDASDVAALRRRIEQLPAEIKRRAMVRAMGRMRDMARTQLKRRVSEKTNLQQRYVKDFVASGYDAEGFTLTIKDGWLPLAKMEPQRHKTLLTVRFKNGSASYAKAFMAQMRSRGMFERTGSARGPVHELFGPNPANAINEDVPLFEDFLADMLEHRLADRTLHEILQLIRR